MADNLTIKDSAAATQTIRAREYAAVKYPQIIDWARQRVHSAATTNATSVKASAGTIGGIYVTNTNAAVRYLKLYNKASAPTVGTDVPVWTIAIPANSERDIPIPGGMAFSTGIAFAITTGAADTDATAVAANEITGAIAYL